MNNEHSVTVDGRAYLTSDVMEASGIRRPSALRRMQKYEAGKIPKEGLLKKGRVGFYRSPQDAEPKTTSLFNFISIEEFRRKQRALRMEVVS